MGMTMTGWRLTDDDVERLRADPASAAELVYRDVDDDYAPDLDLDKAWHGIHFLLNGTSWSYSDGGGGAVLGGTPLDEAELDYGPPRLVGPAEVTEIAAGLDALDESTLRARFDPTAMTRAEIYPDVIWERDADVFDVYLLPYFGELRDFYRRAAKDHQAILLAVT